MTGWLTLIELFVLAQLSGPRCGWDGTTVENSGSLGCVIPSTTDPYGTRLKLDQFDQIRSSPAGPQPLPVFNPGTQR